MKTFTSFRGISPDNVRNRYVDNIFEDTRHRLFGDRTIRPGNELSIPSANVTEFEEEERSGYLIELAAPGYENDDFTVEVNDELLTISGALSEDRVRNRTSFRRQEHNYHSFSRSWTLPESIDEENITAGYRNGILEVFLPTHQPIEQTKAPRRIAVKS